MYRMPKKKKQNVPPEEESKEVEKELKHEEFVNLYRSTNANENVDMTKMQRSPDRRSRIGIFLTIIVVLSALAAVLGYLVFGKNRLSVEPGEVTVDISSVETVASGDKLTVTIHYTNGSPVTIDNGTVEIVYPGGFYLQSSDPTPTTGENQWEVSDVPSGAEGTITITGQLVGQQGDEKDFTTLFTYTPSNFNSDFQSSATQTVTLTESILKLDVTLAERARTGEELAYVFTMTNTATLPLVNVKAYLQYPERYSPTTADPTASVGNHTWLVDQIDPQETMTVTVKGTVSGEDESTQEFILQVGVQEPDGFFNLQGEDRHSVTIFNPELTLALDGPESVQAGGQLEYTIEVTNPSKIEITDIELQLQFEGDAVATDAVDLDRIAKLETGENSTLTYSTKVKSELPSVRTAIIAKLSVTSAKVAGATVDFEQTASVETAIQGNLALNAEARYFDDDLSKLGSGPLPPTVGKTTEYAIRLSLTAAGSAMESITVQVPLSDDVTFVSSGDDRVSFDATSNTVSFELKNLDPTETKVTSFRVSVTPTKNDVNKLLILVKESIVTATDINSGTTVQAQAKKITTRLETDPGTADEGVVVEE